MKFANSHLSYLFLALPIILALMVFGARLKAKLRNAFISEALVTRMMPDFSHTKQLIKQVLFLLAITLVIVGLMRPQFGIKFNPKERQGLDIIIAVDTSLSMQAQDIKPNRLHRAKQEIRALLTHFAGDRVGLMAFAGTAHVLVPRTADSDAVHLFVDDIDHGTVSRPGSDLAEVIAKSLSLFGKDKAPSRALFVFTDGEQFGKGLQKEINAAKRSKLPIYTIGIGNAAGEPIPVENPETGNTEYKKDKDGNVVLSQLDEGTLKRIASETGGRYFHATNDNAIAQQLYKAVSRQEKQAISQASANKYKDQFQFPIFLAIGALIIERILTARRTLGRRKP
ncbi:MAG: VWA domain-containing protein [bacterium]|nr:VWA domain-containing protein [bacterium]